MQYDKKQLEILILDYFRANWSEFPRGKVMPFESPDFILSINPRYKIGIELTRIHTSGNDFYSDDNEPQKRLNKETTAIASEIFAQHLPNKLFVKILFSLSAAISEEQKFLVASRCAAIVKELVQKRNPLAVFQTTIARKHLPREVEQILVVNNPVLQTSVWEPVTRVSSKPVLIESLRFSIQKKDEKMKLYTKKRLNEYWLLITTEGFQDEKQAGLSLTIENFRFDSAFQRVFLFNLMKPEIHEIVLH